MAGYGMHGHLMINMQNSFGTSQVTSLEAIPILSESITLGIEQIAQNNMFGRFADSPTLPGKQSIVGDISMEPEPEALGFFLRTFCGSDDVTAFVHSFKMNTQDFDEIAASVPFTCEIFRDVGCAFIYSDLLANTFELSVSNGELLNTTLGVIGAGFSRQAASSPIYPTGQTVFKWDQSCATFNGASVFDITELTISGNKNLEGLWTLQSSNTPRKIKRTSFEQIEIEGTMLFQSHSYMQAFEAQSENAFVINFESNSPNSLKIDFPSFKLITFDPVMPGPDVVEASFSGRAEYNVNCATQMEITLTNIRTLNY